MRIGVDLGGTKIEAIVLDDDGAERVRRRIDSPQGSYHATIDAIAGLVSAVAEETDCRKDLGVGIGIPGATSPETGNVKNAQFDMVDRPSTGPRFNGCVGAAGANRQ